MDIGVRALYSSIMFRALIIAVSVISFAVVTFAVRVHETGMIGMKDYGALAQHAVHISSLDATCAKDKTCKADTGLCDAVCAGISVWLPFERSPTGHDSERQRYRLSLDAILLSAAPGLNDRPPISRLL